MKRQLTEPEKAEIFKDIQEFLADEFDLEPEEITKETNIIEDLGGDSILFLEMIEEVKERYGIDIEIRILGLYMLKNPVYTVGETLEALYDIVEKGEELIKELEEEELQDGGTA